MPRNLTFHRLIINTIVFKCYSIRCITVTTYDALDNPAAR